MASTDPRRATLKPLWPTVHTQFPKPWSVPLMMTAIGTIPWLKLAANSEQLFKHHNMEASLEIPVGVPGWLVRDFADMLQSAHGCTLNLTIYRFHLGNSLTIEDWEDQWFQVTCHPHFSYMPYTTDAQDDGIDYTRCAFVKDAGLQPMAERACADLSAASFPSTPPQVDFCGFVDSTRFVLADNPSIGLDETTRNSSAVFLTWSKFPELVNGTKPEAGWYPNYVYAMFPKTKTHLVKRCASYQVNTTPFRKHGKKAYIRGYMHGFCHKENVFAPEARPNLLEFVPFVEITDIDWVGFATDAKNSPPDVPATPSKRGSPTDTRSQRRIEFDPFAAGPRTLPARSEETGSVDGVRLDALDDGVGGKRHGEDVTEGGSDGPSPTKKGKGTPRGKSGWLPRSGG